jgi:hypothetical protein
LLSVNLARETMVDLGWLLTRAVLEFGGKNSRP